MSCADAKDFGVISQSIYIYAWEKGIDKYMVFEVAEDLVKSRYGQHYYVTMADRKQSDILRIVDVDGQQIFRNFDLKSLGSPIFYEEPAAVLRAA
jgi:hypothetical protein